LEGRRVKIILSRKGFDSAAGGCASPILPDGHMVSLPIPTSLDTLSYDDLRAPTGLTYRQLLQTLGCTRGIEGRGAHLDPDLQASARARPSGWRPSLGQIGAAAGHLRNQGVGAGDLFLFYGWFRHTLETEGRLRFSRDPGVHVIFGYLEVSELVRADASSELPTWMRDHPHAVPARRKKATNVVYTAASRLSHVPSRPGAGLFKFNERLVLTAPGMTRGRWRLPPSIFRNLSISYHDAGAWRNGYFQSYARAQEYVVHTTEAAKNWAIDLLDCEAVAEDRSEIGGASSGVQSTGGQRREDPGASTA
jgi:hypothetical protein